MDELQQVSTRASQPKGNKIGSWFKKGVYQYGLKAFFASLAFLFLLRYRLTYPIIFPGSNYVADDTVLLKDFDTTRLWIPENFNFTTVNDNVADPQAYLSNFTEKRPNTFAALWVKPNTGNPPKTILYFHGNASTMDYDVRIFREFAELSNANLLCIEYPKYGVMHDYKFEGNPATSVHTVINKWAQSSYNFIKSMGFESNSIALFGFSLGTGPALELGANLYKSGEKVNSIAIYAPYISIKEMAKTLFTFADSLVYDYWNNMKQIKRLNGSKIPLIVQHSETDRMIPFKQGKALYDAYDGLKLDIFWQPGGHDLYIETVAIALQHLWARKDKE